MVVVRIALLLGAFVVGWVLFAVFPSAFGRPLHSPRSVLLSLLVGLLVLVATPVAALILVLTVVGLPLGIILLGCYALALYLGVIVVAATLGRTLVHAEPGQNGRFAAGLLLGLVIITIAVSLPVIGVGVRLLVILLGLGALVQQVHALRRRAGPRGAPVL
jgi:hypothetical protein